MTKNKYKVIYEVSKFAIVEAENEAEAVEMLMNGSIEAIEDEITTPPQAYKINQ